MAFYKALDFTFNPQFTDDTAACMVISEHNYAMLLTHEKFIGAARRHRRQAQRGGTGPYCAVWMQAAVLLINARNTSRV